MSRGFDPDYHRDSRRNGDFDQVEWRACPCGNVRDLQRMIPNAEGDAWFCSVDCFLESLAKKEGEAA